MTTGLPMEDEFYQSDHRVAQLEAEVERWKTAARAAILYVPEPERTMMRRRLGLVTE